MKIGVIVAVVVVLLISFAVGLVASEFNPSALPEPGPFETKVATRIKHALVERRSRDNNMPIRPSNRQASRTSGETLYGIECASCHGLDGRHPTDPGRWMYPRAADLTPTDVQAYSDEGLFWVISNGIRLSGMPAFGSVETQEHFWNLVDYIRALAPVKH